MKILRATILVILILHAMPLIGVATEAINGCHTLLQGYISGWIINGCILVAVGLTAGIMAIIEGDF